MDSTSEARFPHPLKIRGTGSIVAAPDSQIDVLPWLKHRKMKKFMGKQDELAVIASGLAARNAQLTDEDLRTKTGLYLCVGFIPFERQEIETIARNSTDNGKFSMDLFSTKGFDEVNPLLTFRCLPNMPIFHVSLNLGIQGPYFITYPGAAQFYVALEQACLALERKEIDFALVGGVADQNNFLVQHHYKRSGLEKKATSDAAGFVCLERNGLDRGLLGLRMTYQPQETTEIERWADVDMQEHLGAASLAVMIDQSSQTGKVQHYLESLDGMKAESYWNL
jgi:3-oxoacyl-(acyl-carrier-protein) synthase